MSKNWDLILWGATGFTGELVAEYLLQHAPEDLRWALGGRNEAKLKAVRDRLTTTSPRAKSLQFVLADAQDADSLNALCASTRVVATTVGPFRIHGAPLVAAAARNGTHYCDLTGEPHFVRAMIDAHHEEAKRTGAKIVHCTGFDSIPSDLGVLMVQEFAKTELGAPVSTIRAVTRRMSGGISGGTIASALNLAEEAVKDPTVRRQIGNPYVLDPDRKDRGPDGSDQRGMKWDEDAKVWTAPWVMASINTRVVRRSNALLGYAYGRDFRYSEAMGLTRGPKGALLAAGITAGLGGFFVAAASGPGRSVLKRFLPAQGEGPDKATREKGHFHYQLYGHGKDRAGRDVRVVGDVKGTSDPGYGETAKMFSETALALAEKGSPGGGGVLTPASAPGLGMHLVDRLRRAGMTFDVRIG